MHSREYFAVYLYALNPSDGSHRRRRMEDEVENFRDLSALTPEEATSAISSDGIGVLVNLNGYAGTARSADIFALRPAPVVVSYMGFPGTMGSAAMADYILADGTVIPTMNRRFFAEKVLQVSQSYFVNDYKQSEVDVITDPPLCREAYGLPPKGTTNFLGGLQDEAVDEIGKITSTNFGGTVLCNFNRLHKIDPVTYRIWMQVKVSTNMIRQCYQLPLRVTLYIPQTTREFFGTLVSKTATDMPP